MMSTSSSSTATLPSLPTTTTMPTPTTPEELVHVLRGKMEAAATASSVTTLASTGNSNDAVQAALATSVKPLFFLDYDGTLTPIVEDPMRARLNEPSHHVLARFTHQHRTCIVTGRKYETIRSFVDMPHVQFATSHGMQVWDADGTLQHEVGSDFVPVLNRFETRVRERLSNVAGVRIENNQFCISVHYRLVHESERASVERTVDELVQDEEFAAHVHKRGGLLVHEVRPNYPWHKGKVVRWLIDRTHAEEPFAFAVPVYIGDDLTDEDAFRELQQHAYALTVHVQSSSPSSSSSSSARPTLAAYRLAGPDQVIEFLRLVSISRV